MISEGRVGSSANGCRLERELNLHRIFGFLLALLWIFLDFEVTSKEATFNWNKFEFGEILGSSCEIPNELAMHWALVGFGLGEEGYFPWELEEVCFPLSESVRTLLPVLLWLWACSVSDSVYKRMENKNSLLIELQVMRCNFLKIGG